MNRFSQSLIAVCTFSSNFFFAFKGGYFDPSAELNPLLHTWSLAVEEQFYVFFPVLLLLMWRFGKRTVLIFLGFIFLASLTLAEVYYPRNPIATFYLLPGRSWELMIGSFTAFYLARARASDSATRLHHMASLLGLLLILFAVFFYNASIPFPSLYTLVPTVGAALIILFSRPETLVGRLLGSPVMVGIGLISYSAYLWHQPLFAFTRIIFLDRPSTALMLILTLVSFMLAYLAWKFVETPFRNRQKFERKTIFINSAAFSLIVVVLGVSGITSNGFENRLPYNSRDLVVFGKTVKFAAIHSTDKSCQNLLGLSEIPEEVCVTNSQHPKILFAGDSHAMALYSSIYGKEFNLDSLLISGYSCPLYPNLSYIPAFKNSYGNTCPAIANEVIKAAKQFDSIKEIILVNYRPDTPDSRYAYYQDGKGISEQKAFEIGNDYMIDRLLETGKKVVYFIDVPHLKNDPRLCLQKLPFSFRPATDPGYPRACSISKEENDEARKTYLAEVSAIKKNHPQILIFDPASFFCKERDCNFKDGDRSLYNDTHHVSVLGSIGILDTMKSDALIGL
ncbi:acyltransferase [Silvimonas iriomotensis]|uniref:Acyltransferase n=2 Tax=Silvimonas iriomotensis TaxID=449662 RepID=A0ABQ2P423_9NEIS|nr:acyltransferase [Silvimonas iriomotensis]